MFRLLTPRHAQFWFFRGSPIHPCTILSRKIFLKLYPISSPNFIVWLSLLLQIFGNVCDVIICFPACDVIGRGNIVFWKEGNEPTLWYIFKKNKDVLVTSVYLTAMYRCDQPMITRLNIANVGVRLLAVIMRV